MSKNWPSVWRLSFLNGALLDKQLNHLKWKKKQNLWGEAKSMNLGGTKAFQEHGRCWASLRQILRSRRWFCLDRILGSAAFPHCLRSTHFPKPWFRYDPHPKSLCFILPTQEVVLQKYWLGNLYRLKILQVAHEEMQKVSFSRPNKHQAVSLDQGAHFDS